MNSNQRISVIFSLVVTGAMLFNSMTIVTDNERSTVSTQFYTLLSSWETQPKSEGYVTDPELLKQLGRPVEVGGNVTFEPWVPPVPARRYLYVEKGITGILLGLLTPLAFWGFAVFIALGSRGASAQSMQQRKCK